MVIYSFAKVTVCALTHIGNDSKQHLENSKELARDTRAEATTEYKGEPHSGSVTCVTPSQINHVWKSKGLPIFPAACFNVRIRVAHCCHRSPVSRFYLARTECYYAFAVPIDRLRISPAGIRAKRVPDGRWPIYVISTSWSNSSASFHARWC